MEHLQGNARTDNELACVKSGALYSASPSSTPFTVRML